MTQALIRKIADGGFPGLSPVTIRRFQHIAEGKELPPVPATLADAPCIHRGSFLRTVPCKPCQNIGATADIYHCGLFGECSFKAGVLSKGMSGTVLESCKLCESRVAQHPQPLRKVVDTKPPKTPARLKWAVGVTTAPRNPSTVHRCVERLQACGWEPVLFAEPGTDLAGISARIVQREKKLGPWHNWREMCLQLLAENPDADAFLTVQDDTLITTGAKAFLDQALWPHERVGYVSLYCSRKYDGMYQIQHKGKVKSEHLSLHAARTRKKESGGEIVEVPRPPGVRRVGETSLWGACALVFSRQSLTDILDHPVARSWKGFLKSSAHGPANVDTAIGRVTGKLGYEAMVFSPSLAQHIAPVSSIPRHGTNAGNRAAGRYVGDNADLREIFGTVEGIDTAELSYTQQKRRTTKHVPPGPKLIDFRTYAQMVRDSQEWAGRLRGKIGAVCGVPRSGMLPATIIAQELRLPLVPIEALLYQVGAFRNPTARELVQSDLPTLVVDDSLNAGHAMEFTRQKLQHVPGLVFGALYDTGADPDLLDYSGHRIQIGHTFEWILFRDSNCRYYAVDLDGVLCEDWSGPEEGEHAERYARHLAEAKPLVLPSRPIHRIVTGRLERHRAETVAWLEKHGIEFSTLTMHPAKSPAERKDAARHKAEAFKGDKHARLFIESCPLQSRRIFELSGKPALCYPTMEFFS